MTTQDAEATDKTTFWKGLAIFMGIVLLLAVVAWSRDRHAMKGGHEHARAQLAEAEATLEGLRADGIRSEARAEQMVGELSARETQLNALAAEVAAERDQRTSLTEQSQLQIAEFEAALTATRGSEGLARARVARLEEHCEDLKKRQRGLDRDRAALEERLAASTGVAREVSEERKRWRLERDDLQAMVATLRAELTSRRAKFDKSRQEFEKMKAQNTTMRRVTLDAEKRVVDLSRRHAETLAQLENFATRAVAVTPSSLPPSGDSMAELRILRARDETQAREIHRLNQEIEALKAALQRPRR